MPNRYGSQLNLRLKLNPFETEEGLLMFKNLKIGVKILIILSSVAIVAVGINGYIGYTAAKTSLEEESFNKLTAIREMKANQIENYFEHIRNEVITFSEDRMIIDAMKKDK